MIYITNNTFHKINSICQLTNENIIGNTELNEKFITNLKNEVYNIESVIIKYYHKPKNKFAVSESLNNFSATYHTKFSCRLLQSDYNDIPFPQEIIESILDSCDVNKSTIQKTKQFLQNEETKYKQLVKKHFSNFGNVDINNIDFINEVDEIWNINKKINFITVKNSGTIEIDDLDLKNLEIQVSDLLEKINNNINNEVGNLNILTILYNIFVCNNRLKYKNNKLEIIQNEIQNILQKITKIDFEMNKYIPIFFQMFLNKNLKFENSLSEQLDLTHCSVECTSASSDELIAAFSSLKK